MDRIAKIRHHYEEKGYESCLKLIYEWIKAEVIGLKEFKELVFKLNEAQDEAQAQQRAFDEDEDERWW